MTMLALPAPWPMPAPAEPAPLAPIADAPAPAPAPPSAVRPGDMYAALLADARKPTTRRAREQDAGDLARFLGAPDEAAACALVVSQTAAHANAIATAYVRSILDRRLAPSTINRRVSTLRRLCKLARRFDVVSWSLDVESLPAAAYRDTVGPGRAGWLRILDVATKAAARTAKGKRDLVLVRFMHDHGLRRNEVVSLDIADWDPDSGRLWITGKGKGERAPIRLNKPTVLGLCAWLDARGPELGPLFVRLDRAAGKLDRLDGDGVHLVVGELGRKAGLGRRVRPHGLRHQAVTRVLELTGGNIVAAQKFARHADPKTTQKYNDNRSDLAGQMAKLLGDDS